MHGTQLYINSSLEYLENNLLDTLESSFFFKSAVELPKSISVFLQ